LDSINRTIIKLGIERVQACSR